LSLYTTRFSKDELAKKQRVWEALCKHYFQKFVSRGARVLDLASGYCEFINNIECAEKYAIDTDSESLKWAENGVNAIQQSCTSLLNFPDSFFDLIFASNIFEHLRSKDELETVLRHVRRILKPSGHILVLGPNVKYAYKEYWDFFDHHIPLSDRSLCEALVKNGFEIIKSIPRFLPYTTKSHLPKSKILTELYLMLPILWKMVGQQMLVYAIVRKNR